MKLKAEGILQPLLFYYREGEEVIRHRSVHST